MIAFLLYKLGGALGRILPVRFSYTVADFFAALNFLVNRTSRRAVIENLRQVHAAELDSGSMTPAALRRRALRVFQHFARNIVDFLRLPLLDLETLSRTVEFQGREHLEAALAAGRGVILLSMHAGNWEWGGAVFALNGVRVKAVALDHGEGRVTRFFTERRRSKGVESLPLVGSTFAMLRCLRAGGVVALLADRDVARQGTDVRFFGRSTKMPRAHAILALKTGARVLPTFTLREPGERLRIIISPPVSPAGLDAKDGVGAFVERCLEPFEVMLRRHSDQWCVFVPLWEKERAREPGGRARG